MRAQILPNQVADDTLPLYVLDQALAAVLDLGPSLLIDVKPQYVLGGALGSDPALFRAMNIADESLLIAPGSNHPTFTNTGMTGAGRALGFGWRGDLDFSPANGWLVLQDDRTHDLSGDWTAAFCVFVPTADQTTGNRGGVVIGERADNNPNYLGLDYNEGDFRLSIAGTTYAEISMNVGLFHSVLISYSVTAQAAAIWIDDDYVASATNVPPWGATRLMIGGTGSGAANNFHLVADVSAALVLSGKAFMATGPDADRDAVLAWLEQVRVRSVA